MQIKTLGCFSQLKQYDPIFDNYWGGLRGRRVFPCGLKIARLKGGAPVQVRIHGQICNRQLAIVNAIVCAPFPGKDRPASALDFRLHFVSATRRLL